MKKLWALTPGKRAIILMVLKAEFYYPLVNFKEDPMHQGITTAVHDTMSSL